MGFLAPAIPAIGGLVGGLFGSHSNAVQGVTPAEKMGMNILGQVSPMQIAALGQGLGMAPGLAATGQDFMNRSRGEFDRGDIMTNYGMNNLNTASNAINPALNYWTNVLAGGPEAALALSPEIQQIRASSEAAKRQLATTGPMGGGRASAMAQLPFQQGTAISNLYSQARPAAASALATQGIPALTGISNAYNSLAGTTNQAGAAQGGIGAGLSSNVFSGLLGAGNAAGNNAANLLSYGLGRSAQNQQNAAGFGGGITNILNSLPWGKWLGGSGTINAPNQGPPNALGQWP